MGQQIACGVAFNMKKAHINPNRRVSIFYCSGIEMQMTAYVRGMVHTASLRGLVLETASKIALNVGLNGSLAKLAGTHNL